MEYKATPMPHDAPVMPTPPGFGVYNCQSGLTSYHQSYETAKSTAEAIARGGFEAQLYEILSICQPVKNFLWVSIR